MTFRVIGANADTGSEVDVVIQAESKAEVEAKAAACGILISSIEVISDSDVHRRQPGVEQVSLDQVSGCPTQRPVGKTTSLIEDAGLDDLIPFRGQRIWLSIGAIVCLSLIIWFTGIAYNSGSNHTASAQNKSAQLQFRQNELAEQRAKDEAARIAAEQRQREEAARIAAEQRQRAEYARAAARGAATAAYLKQVSQKGNASKISDSDSYSEKISKVRGLRSTLLSIDTDNVDTDAVECVVRMAAALREVADVQEKIINPSTYLNAYVRSQYGDNGAAADFVNEQQKAMNDLQSAVAALESLKPILKSRYGQYGVEFDF